MKTKEADMIGVRILNTERLNNSVNGNPRFRIRFYDMDGTWEYDTSSDAAINYEVSNYANSREMIDVWLTKAGRVWDMRPTRQHKEHTHNV